MARPSFPTNSLHATWLGEQVGLWINHADATPRDISNAAVGVFGPELRTIIGERPDDVDLYEIGGAAPPARTISVLPVDVQPLTEQLLPRSSNQRWSPSVAWLHHATLIATEIAVSGRAIPSLRTAGLRWRADWTSVADAEWEGAVERLASIVPPAMVAASEESVLDQVIKITNALIDSVSRFALREQDWRPPLPRTRASNVVALRRATTAWSSDDSVFLADSVAHESAFADWSTQLAEYSSRVLGAPDVSLQGRLEPPTALDGVDDVGGNDDGPWQLYLEVVAADGTTIGFDDVWESTPDALELADAAGLVPLRQRMRELIDRLATQLAALSRLLDESHPSVLLLDIDEVSDLLSEGLTACRLAGLPILTPTGLLSRSARLTARAQTDTSFGRTSGISQAMVNVDWGLALGDVSLTQEEIEELARSSADIVALRGEWVQVDRRQMRAALKRLETQRREASELTPAELLRETISEMGVGSSEDFSAEGWIADLLDGLPDDELSEAVESAGFNGQLRPYQRRALGWLQFLGRLGLGGCLADDMGLGKTPTALAHILERTLERFHAGMEPLPHLVICPLSVVTNWENEAKRFAPELSVMIAHGPDRPRGRALAEAAANHNIVITTYGTASRTSSDLSAIPWDVVICDEAQAIKNHRTNAAITIRELASQQRVALTGTPVENRLTELWSILDALNPGMLGGITWFRNQFANPIERGEGEEALESLRALTAPFVLRRTKADRSLVPDLPDKIEQVAWATLTPEQAGLYQAVLDDFMKSASEATGMERRGLVLATLTKLKQVCNHPAHFLREGSVGDAERSGKLERLDEILEVIFEAEERTLIFTQYREMGLLLSDHIEARFGFEAPFLHGGTTLKNRQKMVDVFQGPDGPPAQLISLRAGGTGLNLTAASRVIHFDRWWNPAVEDQATDRTWRIGQDKTVFVHKLVCRGTLEERIDTMLTEKRALADAVVGTDESWLTELSTEELRELLRLDPSSRQPVLS